MKPRAILFAFLVLLPITVSACQSSAEDFRRQVATAVAVKRDGLHKARRVISEWGVRVTGTLGILVIAVERNIVNLDDANKILLEMIQNGYRSPVNNLTSMLS